MITLPGYHIHQQIHTSSNSLVYRGYRLQDHQPIVLKLLREDYPGIQPLVLLIQWQGMLIVY